VDFHDAAAAAAAVAEAERVEGGGVKVAGRRLAFALAVSPGEAAGLAAGAYTRPRFSST
jgi:nucleolar protein 4